MADHVIYSEGKLLREDGPALAVTDAPFGSTLPLAGGTLTGDVTLASGVDLVLATSTGTQIGTGASQLLAFHGATPTDQPAFIADATGGATIDTQARAAVASILDLLAEKGLMAAS